jgi:glycerol-1-phosphate dehydrogenase [NAD(P)+]
VPGTSPSSPTALSDPTTPSDPTAIPALRSTFTAVDPEGRLLPVHLDTLVVGPDAVDAVPDAVVAQLARAAAAGRATDGPVVVLVDAVRIERAGSDLKTQVVDRLAARFGDERRVTTAVLRGHHSTLHVDDDAMDDATAAVAGAAAIVAVGGGTVSDIAKVAAARADGSPAAAGATAGGPTAGAGGVPLVVVPTAASIDGYTDDVSVVLRDGVKRTVPSRWPDVVVADITTITTAPERLNSSGYGELLSTFTAPADWYLAHNVGLDPSFHRGALGVLTGLGDGLAEWSPGLAHHDPAAVEQLTRRLSVRGVITGVVGTTAALSGTEHVISHMLDMRRGAQGLEIGLHGAQVGVAAVVAAAAWEHLYSVLDPAALSGPALDALFPDAERIAARRPAVLAAFADLDADGRLGEECWRDYSTKLTRWTAARSTVEEFLRDWDRHRATVEEFRVDAATLGAGLVAAGAPARFAELDPHIDDATATWAVGHCHLMRNRFTVVDLLDLLGRWTTQDRDAVMAAAGAAVDAGAVTS